MLAKNTRASVAADAMAMITGVSPFMRRAVLILATMMLGVMMLSGVVLAKNITGTNGGNELKGTNRADKIRGLGGQDYINGRSAADELYGGRGKDEVRGKRGHDYIYGGRDTDKLFGDRGNDTMKARDGYKDYVNCGAGGNDKAYVDADLDTWVNCEDVPGVVTPPPPSQKAQCEDGKDNDSDGKIDYGTSANNDPDCDSKTDDTESSTDPSADTITGDYAGQRMTVGGPVDPSLSMECYTFYPDQTVELRHGGLPDVNDTGNYQGDASRGQIDWVSGRTSSVVAQGDGSLLIDGLKVTPIQKPCKSL